MCVHTVFGSQGGENGDFRKIIKKPVRWFYKTDSQAWGASLLHQALISGLRPGYFKHSYFSFKYDG